MTARRIAYAWLAVLLACSVHHAEEADGDNTTIAPLLFRRVYVPADRVAEWPTGNTPYLPIDANEFAELIEKADANRSGGSPAQGDQIAKAEFKASLVGEDLLVGEAQLEVPESDAKVVSLDPFSPAIRTATWSTAKRPATIGALSDGRLAAWADQDFGPLQLHWSLRGERNIAGAVSFRLDMPQSPIHRITLDLPMRLVMFSDHGVPTIVEGAQKNLRRWQLELGGRNRVTLRLAAEDSTNKGRQLTLLRQSVTYEFSPRGVDVVALLRLDVHGEPISRIPVMLDPNLQLVAARYGESAVPWTPATTATNQPMRVVLELPAPVSGLGRVLRLSAIAPLRTDQKWRLPNLKPEGMFWQEGSATLVISQPLALLQILPKSCRESKTTQLPSPALGESIEVQYYSADATVDLVVGRPRERLKIDTGVQLEFKPGEVSAQMVAELSLRQAEQYLLRADVGPNWSIDSVEASRTEDLADWNIEAAESKSQRLAVQLAKALSAKHSVRLLINAHRTLAPDEFLTPDELQPLSFANATAGRRLLAATTADPYELETTGAETITPLDLEQLAPTDSQLFALPPVGLALSLDSGALRLQMGLASRRPHYRADLHVDALIDGSSIFETSQLQCSPVAARVDRLLVQFAPRSEIARQWSMVGPGTDQVTARRLPSEDPRVGAGVELWELTLRSPRSEPFTIEAKRTVPFQGEQPLSLVALPEAAGQQGTVSIRTLGQTGVAVSARRLRSLPNEPASADEESFFRATYRYQPNRDAGGADTVVSVSPSASARANLDAWVWNCRVDSRYSDGNVAFHQAIIELQTAGRDQVGFVMPGNATVREIAIDGQRTPDDLIKRLKPSFKLDLPHGGSLTTIAVAYETSDSLPSLVNSLQSPLPNLDIPVLERTWTVWLPTGYAIVDSNPRWRTQAAAGLNWRERLFGSLGRKSGEHGFSLLPRGGDDNIPAARGAALARISPSELVEAVDGAVNAAAAASGEVTWGQALSSLRKLLDQSQVMLLCDRAALDELELTPRSKVTRPTGRSSAKRGIELLRAAQLMLLTHAHVVVLTSADQASRLQAQLTEAENDVVSEVRAGSFAELINHSAQQGDSPNYVTVEAWRALPDDLESPWRFDQSQDQPLVDSRGWTSFAIELSDTSVIRPFVIRSAAVRALGWVLFLILLTAGVWIGEPARPTLLISVGLIASAALIAPAAYTAPLAGALIGALCALAWLVMARVPPRLRENSRVNSTSAAPAVQVTSLILAAGIVLASASAGLTQPKPETPGSTANKNEQAGPVRTVPRQADNARIYRVLVPIDDEQKLKGDKYYVPAVMYGELFRRARGRENQPTGWMIDRAAYRGRLSRENLARQVSVAEFHATYDLQTFEPDSRVRIPLSREGMSVAEGGIKLDGQVVNAQWDATGTALQLTIPQPGEYRLDVSLTPTVQTFGTGIGFDLSIPTLALSTLDLEIPADLSGLELPTARGLVSQSKSQDHLTGQLGPINRLAVRWPSEGSGEGEAANLDVDELLWVKVQPGSLVIDARFKFRVIEGRVRQVRLLADPRLRMLPSAGADAVISAIRTQPGTPETIDLELTRPVSDLVTIDVSFVLTGASGVGNLRLPRLEASGARASRRLLAVSVDPALEYSEKTTAGLKPLPTAEFLTQWGTAEVKPQVAYTLPRGEPNWVLSTRPRESITSVEQTLAISVGRGSSIVHFDAFLDTTSGANFQLQLTAPPALEIDNISVLESGAQRVARWSQDDTGLITIFLTGPVSGRQQLAMRGRLRTPERGQLSLSTFQLQNVKIERHHFLVFRQPAVLVEVEHLTGMNRLDVPPSDPSRTIEGSLVSSFDVTTVRGSATLNLTPNPAQVQGVQVTTLELANGQWTVAVDCEVHVTKGIVDELRFEIPQQWSEPFQADRPAIVEVVGTGNSRQLVIRPPAPITDRYRIKIEGRLAVGKTDRVRVPDVAPLESVRLNRFVVLPVQVELQQANWDVVGLKVGALPAEFSELPFAAETFTAYHVTGKRFQADLRPLDRTDGAPFVRLADVTVAWQTDGHIYGVASFDLEPSGTAACVLQIPKQQRLIHIAVDGRPAMLSPAGQNRVRVELPSRHLPQHIDAIFSETSPAVAASVHRTFQAPTLAELNAENTLWSIYGPEGVGHAQVSDGQESSDAASAELLRMKSIMASISAAALSTELSADELANWYPAWEQRFDTSRDALRTAAVLSNPLAAGQTATLSEPEIVARKLAKEQTLLARRFESASGPRTKPIVQYNAAELLTEHRTGQMPHLVVVDGAASSLKLDYPSQPTSDFAERIVWAILVIGATVGLVVILERRPWPKFSPYTIGAVVGLVGWLMLTPALLGFIVLVVSLVGRMRQYWLPSPPPASV